MRVALPPPSRSRPRGLGGPQQAARAARARSARAAWAALTVFLVVGAVIAPGCQTGPPAVAAGEEIALDVALHGDTAPVSAEGARVPATVTLTLRVEEPRQRSAEAVRAEAREAVRDVLQRRLDEGLGPDEAFERLEADAAWLLAREGLRLTDLAVRSRGDERSRRRDELRPTTDLRVLLLGFDGLDWDVARPLMDAGRMPNLARLVERGVHGDLDTLQPILSPVIWTTVATGRSPADHGIVDFLGTDAAGNPVPVTSNLRRTKAFWNVLSEAGESVGVVAWWATWPAEPVRGFLVSDRVAYQLFGMGDRGAPEVGKVHPPGAWEELEPLVTRPEEISPAEIASFLDPTVDAPLDAQDRSLLEQFAAVLASTKTYAAMALKLHEEHEPRVGAYYFEGTDTAAHLFMRYAPPPLPEVEPVRQRRFAPVVARVYEQHDRILGRFMEQADERTVVMLVSDHGFRSGVTRPTSESRVESPTAASWHARFGVIAAAGPGIREGTRIREASVEDVLPTMLALLGMPVPDDFAGRVLTEALTERFLEENPVRRIDTFEDPDVSHDPRRFATASADDRAILEELVAIGYVSASTLTGGGDGSTTGSGDGSTTGGGDGSAQGGDGTGTGLGANARNNLGTILLNQGDLDAAIDEFRAAVELAPDFVPARVNLAHALLRVGEPDRAIAELERSLELDATHDRALSLLAAIHVDEGRAEKALEIARSTTESHPRSAHARAALARALEATGNLEAARDAWRRASELSPDDPEPLNSLGNTHERVGDWEEAARWYARALEADPRYAPAYNNLALQYQRLGRLDEAREVYEEGRRRLPGSSVVLNNLATWHHQAARAARDAGLAAMAAGDVERARELRQRFDASARRAEELYREAREAEPLDPSPLNNLGALMGLLGRDDEQLALYEEALDIEPHYLDARHNVGDWHVRRGNWERAHAAFTAVLEREPDYVESLRLDALTLVRLGRGEDGVELLEAALGRRPANAALWVALGGVHDELGRVDEACRAYARALELAPGSSAVAERHGAICDAG